MRSGGLGSGRCGIPILLSGLLLWGIGCGPGPEEIRARDPRPNVLLISMDTTRADHLSVYGYARDTSPSLRALAERGTLFEIAYAPSATTGPSHASLFTSLPPISHGVLKNGRRLNGEFETLAEILAEAGYETSAVVSSFVLSGRFGYGQGFGFFDEDFSNANVPQGTTLWEGRSISGKFYGSADDTTRRALSWLDARDHPGSPFFLFVHYFDPHDPYLPPEGYSPPFRPGPKEALKLNRSVFLYDTLLSFTDHEIGRLLEAFEARGLARDTLVIVTGDHGEGLMQRGHMFHGVHLYEEGVRVPLIFSWPGEIPPDRVSAGPISLVDLAPSILELAGIGPHHALEGQSLAAAIRGLSRIDPERPVHLYRRPYEGEQVADGVYAEGEKFALRRGPWKLIEGPAENSLELFDLEGDPLETRNLACVEPEVVARMREDLTRWRGQARRETSGLRPLDDEERLRLEALGYSE